MPHYGGIFRKLWERHKNPISWVFRPFFGLIMAYGAILHSWIIILIGVIGIGTSWFWFPKWKQTPEWAEDFINKELEILTPENPWDAKRVLLPSFGLPIALAALAALLGYLPHPWNWLGLLILVLMTLVKIVWSARLQRTILKPVTLVILFGYLLGAIVGASLFISLS